MGDVTKARSVNVQELRGLGEKVELIDVRTPAEYGSAHVPYARSAPLDGLDPKSVMASRTKPGEPLYVICRSGGRSAKACAAFVAAGFPEVVNVEGGTLAWEQAGFPVDRGKYVLPLDRQVRIVIGVFVVLGVALGALVHPVLYGLSALCGLGLIFAGITDFCPMARTIAKMPWNK